MLYFGKISLKANMQLYGICFGHIKQADLKIVEIPHVSEFSELRLCFIVIYEHTADQDSVTFSVSIIFYKFRLSKCKESVCLHYSPDLTSNLIYCRVGSN